MSKVCELHRPTRMIHEVYVQKGIYNYGGSTPGVCTGRAYSTARATSGEVARIADSVASGEWRHGADKVQRGIKQQSQRMSYSVESLGEPSKGWCLVEHYLRHSADTKSNAHIAVSKCFPPS